jgi:nucleotide-binding universal stress UspA family protein
MMYRTILVPLDGSELAEQALPHAVNLARASGARLVLVQLYVEQHELDSSLGDEIYETWSDAEAYLADVARPVAAEGLPVEIRAKYGSAVEGILSEIVVSDVDLVVMCAHGRRGLTPVPLGPVAAEMLRRSPVPVLLMGPTALRTTTPGEPVA